MRTYGRVLNEDGSRSWQVVETDASGQNDAVWLTTMIQVCQLNLGESPFYANYGIPAQQTIMSQIFPDFYAAAIQEQFAPFFAKLTISRVQSSEPYYDVAVLTHSGATISNKVPI